MCSPAAWRAAWWQELEYYCNGSATFISCGMAFFGGCTKFCENRTCAHATLSWLCPWRVPPVVVRVRSLSMWRSVNFDSTRATLSWLWACQVALISLWHGANFDFTRETLSWLWACRVALVVARSEFWHRPRNATFSELCLVVALWF